MPSVVVSIPQVTVAKLKASSKLRVLSFVHHGPPTNDLLRTLLNARLVLHLIKVRHPDPDVEICPDLVKAESSLCHLPYGLILGPALHLDALNRAHSAGAVGAVTTVDKHGNAAGV